MTPPPPRSVLLSVIYCLLQLREQTPRSYMQHADLQLVHNAPELTTLERQFLSGWVHGRRAWQLHGRSVA